MDGKRYFMQVDILKSWGTNIYITKNGLQNKGYNKRKKDTP